MASVKIGETVVQSFDGAKNAADVKAATEEMRAAVAAVMKALGRDY